MLALEHRCSAEDFSERYLQFLQLPNRSCLDFDAVAQILWVFEEEMGPRFGLEAGENDADGSPDQVIRDVHFLL